MPREDYTKLDNSLQAPASNPSPSATESVHYRHVLGHFATGVTIITALSQNQPIGFTANSFCSVSLSPPLISFCVDNFLSTWTLIEAAGKFCVNILSEEQKELAQRFGRKGTDRFSEIDFRCTVSGSPILAGILAWLDCHIVTTLPTGDHRIVLGQVDDLTVVSEGKPLIFYRSTFGSFRARNTW